MRRNLWRSLALLILAWVSIAESSAFADSMPLQLHARTGLLDAMLGGAKGVDPFMAMPILDGEVEFLTSFKKTHLAHLTFANDMSTAQTRYFSASYGQRYYVWNTNSHPVSLNDGKLMYSSLAGTRYYAGWEVGLGQVQAAQINLSLNLTSTVLEFGGHVGVIHQITNEWGVGGHFGLAYGYGFSSVAVAGIFVRALASVTYFY